MDDQMFSLMQQLMGKCKEQIQRASIESFYAPTATATATPDQNNNNQNPDKDFLNNNPNIYTNHIHHMDHPAPHVTHLSASQSYQIL
jgi:hypothetical protein